MVFKGVICMSKSKKIVASICAVCTCIATAVTGTFLRKSLKQAGTKGEEMDV